MNANPWPIKIRTDAVVRGVPACGGFAAVPAQRVRVLRRASMAGWYLCRFERKDWRGRPVVLTISGELLTPCEVAS